jgi:hypothetical protein
MTVPVKPDQDDLTGRVRMNEPPVQHLHAVPAEAPASHEEPRDPTADVHHRQLEVAGPEWRPLGRTRLLPFDRLDERLGHGVLLAEESNKSFH